MSIVSSAGAMDSMSSASGVKDFPPLQSFIWFYVLKHAIYAYTVEIRISPRGLICKNDFLAGGLFEGGLFEGGDLIEDLWYLMSILYS